MDSELDKTVVELMKDLAKKAGMIFNGVDSRGNPHWVGSQNNLEKFQLLLNENGY